MTTERTLLDALWDRLTRPSSPGMPPRYVMAEQVRYTPAGGYRIADALAVDTWGSGGYAVEGYEVKTSRADWRRELTDPSKAETWRQHCSRWYILAPPDVVVRAELPDGWGLLIASPTRSGGTSLRCTVPSANVADPVPLGARQVAALMRATQQTAQRHARAPEPALAAPTTTRCGCIPCGLRPDPEGRCTAEVTDGRLCLACATYCSRPVASSVRP